MVSRPTVPFRKRGAEDDGVVEDVVVDRRTFAQRASADCTYRLTWPGIDVRVTSRMTVALDESGLDVTIDVEAYDGEEQMARREWTERLPR